MYFYSKLSTGEPSLCTPFFLGVVLRRLQERLSALEDRGIILEETEARVGRLRNGRGAQRPHAPACRSDLQKEESHPCSPSGFPDLVHGQGSK